MTTSLSKYKYPFYFPTKHKYIFPLSLLIIKYIFLQPEKLAQSLLLFVKGLGFRKYYK